MIDWVWEQIAVLSSRMWPHTDPSSTPWCFFAYLFVCYTGDCEPGGVVVNLVLVGV